MIRCDVIRKKDKIRRGIGYLCVVVVALALKEVMNGYYCGCVVGVGGDCCGCCGLTMGRRIVVVQPFCIVWF